MAAFVECKDACSQLEQPQNTRPAPENWVFMNRIIFFNNKFSKAWKMMLFQKCMCIKFFDQFIYSY